MCNILPFQLRDPETGTPLTPEHFLEVREGAALEVTIPLLPGWDEENDEEQWL